MEGNLAGIVRDLQQAARVLAGLNCLPATDGNLSARLDGGRVVLTRKGIAKRELQPTDFVTVDVHESAPDGASSEWMMHRALYQHRPDVQCVLHAHAPGLTAFAVTERVPNTMLLAESALLLGRIAAVPFVTPGSAALGAAVIAADSRAAVYLLANHGAVAVGETVAEALYRLERAEFLAQVEIAAAKLGAVIPLSDSQIAEIRYAYLRATNPAGAARG